MNKFNQLQQELSEHEIEFVNLKLPMGHVKDNIFEFVLIDNENEFDSFGGFVQYAINDSIAITLRNLTGYQIYEEDSNFKRKYAYSYATIKSWIKNSEWYKFDELQSFKNQYIDVAEKLNKTEFVAAIFDGEIVGVYKNYNGIQHQQLLDTIKEFGLSNRIVNYNLTETDLTLNLFIENDEDDIEDTGFLYDLVLVNGLDSWNSLKFYVYFKFRDLEIHVDIDKGSKRHLSNVNDIFEQISIYLDKMENLNFKKTLRDTPSHVLVEYMNQAIDKTNDKHVELYVNVKSAMNNLIASNGVDFFEDLAAYRTRHGYKMAADELGWSVMYKVFNLD